MGCALIGRSPLWASQIPVDRITDCWHVISSKCTKPTICNPMTPLLPLMPTCNNPYGSRLYNCSTQGINMLTSCYNWLIIWKIVSLNASAAIRSTAVMSHITQPQIGKAKEEKEEERLVAHECPLARICQPIVSQNLQPSANMWSFCSIKGL